MTHPRTLCAQLLPDFTVCRIPFAEHTNQGHDFVVKGKWRGHIPSKLSITACGRTDVYVILDNDAPRYIRQAMLNSSVCQACLKNWFYLRERSRILGWV